MDITRMLKMMVNMATRQLMRRGINKAISATGRSTDSGQADQQERNKPSSKVDPKRIRKSLKTIRRITRF